jgi:DinB superfamily
MHDGTWQSLVLRQFCRVGREFVTALTDLDERMLNELAPGVDNSIGWVAWHLTRGIDRNLAEIAGEPQLWLSQGWAQQFGRSADPADTGFGHSPEETAAFVAPSGAALVAYHEGVQARLAFYLEQAADTDLRRETVSPTLGNVHTVEERVAALLYDSFAHVGQIALLRSVLSGRSGER